VQALHPVQNVLGRDINPKLYSAKEWQATKKAKSAFIRDILKTPVIIMIGDSDDLG
jgi:hypothetical protein